MCIINTIITIIRDLTNCNISVQIAAPLREAAYNMKGSTINWLLKIDLDDNWTKSSGKKKSDTIVRSCCSNPLVLATYDTRDSVSHGSDEMSHGRNENLDARSYNQNSARANNSFRRFLGSYLNRGATCNGWWSDGSNRITIGNSSNWIIDQ